MALMLHESSGRVNFDVKTTSDSNAPMSFQQQITPDQARLIRAQARAAIQSTPEPKPETSPKSNAQKSDIP